MNKNVDILEKKIYFSKIRKAKGVTLVALIVTIIVLLIIAGITIASLTGNGILSKTQEATSEYDKQIAIEQMNFKITNMQIASYSKTKEIPSLQDIADKLCEDNEIEYVLSESKTIGSLDKINVGEANSIFTKLKKYEYEFEIDRSLRLASINGVKVAENNTSYNELNAKIEEMNLKIESLQADNEQLKTDNEQLRGRLDTLENENVKENVQNMELRLQKMENKTTMKTQYVEKSNISINNGVETKILSATIAEDCYANIYSRYGIVNNDSSAFKSIYVFLNGVWAAGNGKGGGGGIVGEDVNCFLKLKKGDVIEIRAQQYTGSAKTIQSAFLRINYFPI